MSRARLNVDKWSDIMRELHAKPVAPAAPPEQSSEKQEFARRPFGSVNVYIRKLEIENAKLRQRILVLEQR
jgi:hypothetical protein